MNSSSEVVAIEGTGSRRDHPMMFRTNFKSKKQYKQYPSFVDPLIVPRIKQYLEANRHKVFVDVDEMVRDLRMKYRDYATKQRDRFKKMVEEAFSVVQHSYQEIPPEVESDSSDGSDVDEDSEELDLIVDNNLANRNQQVLYRSNKGTTAAPNLNSSGNKELIDISSSDDDDVAPCKQAKTSETRSHDNNGAHSESVAKQPNNQEHQSCSSSFPENNGEVMQDAPQYVVNKRSELPSTSVAGRPKRKKQAGDAIASSSGPSQDTSHRKRREVPLTESKKSFKDVGGGLKVLQEVCNLLKHIRHPEIYKHLGISPPRGFLLHGPPGCGKTLLASAIAGELKVPLLKVAAPELVAGVSGESEERIRDLFDQAISLSPCIVFIDEIDAITPNRNNAQREMERRIVAQLLTSLDELGDKEGGNQVLVVGATNRPDALDPALRRAGRFDREVCMGIPDREARAHILRVVCGSLALAPEVASDQGIEELASLTPGFVGADLTALAREAAMCSVNRIFSDLNKINVDESSKSQTEEIIKAQESHGISDIVDHEMKENNIQENSSGQSEKVTDLQDSNEILLEENSANVTSNSVADNAPTNTETEEKLVEEDGVGIIVEGPGCDPDTEGKESSSNTVDVNSSQIDNEEQNKDCVTVQQVSNDAEHDAPQVGISSDVTPQEVEIISLEVREKRKSESDVETCPTKKKRKYEEVVEVEMVECNGKVSDNPEPSASVPSTEKNTSSEKVGFIKMNLSQQLNPVSTVTPELCEQLSWLRETPALTPEQLNNLSVSMEDFHAALRHVQPSATREGFATVPDVTWDDVGSLSNVRAELQLAILAPVRYSQQFSKLGLTVPTGVLLCGPPGCGKTLLAKAVANEAGINFISVKGPELLNMYVGESERAVRQVFQRARNSAPCVIFFDELDALCPKRSDLGDNGVSSRVVNQLLTEMDGVEGRSAVFLMAASNRPDIIDPAVLRPGRLDKVLYVGLPSAEDRVDILRALTKNGSRPLLAPEVNLSQIATSPLLEGYTGADLAALVREAGVQCLKEFIEKKCDVDSPISISETHFKTAVENIRPSVTDKDRKHYDRLQMIYSSRASVRQESMDTM